MALVVGVAAAAIGVAVVSYGLYAKLFRSNDPSEITEPNNGATKTQSSGGEPLVSTVNEV